MGNESESFGFYFSSNIQASNLESDLLVPQVDSLVRRPDAVTSRKIFPQWQMVSMQQFVIGTYNRKYFS